MSENFYDASIRHWYNGKLSEMEGEYDNAVCMQGFAAECALKKILNSAYPIEKIIKYSHGGASLFDDICMMLTNDNSMLSILDPASGLRLSQINLSEKLFENHPERRYFSDGVYTREIAIECRKNTEEFMNEMFQLYIDGYIKK